YTCHGNALTLFTRHSKGPAYPALARRTHWDTWLSHRNCLPAVSAVTAGHSRSSRGATEVCGRLTVAHKLVCTCYGAFAPHSHRVRATAARERKRPCGGARSPYLSAAAFWAPASAWRLGFSCSPSCFRRRRPLSSSRLPTCALQSWR